MRKYFLLCIFLYSCSSEFDLKNGDILFQDLDSSELCIAIEGVSEGYNGSNLSHIGMIVKQNNQILVIEALPPKVVLTPGIVRGFLGYVYLRESVQAAYLVYQVGVVIF